MVGGNGNIQADVASLGEGDGHSILLKSVFYSVGRRRAAENQNGQGWMRDLAPRSRPIQRNRNVAFRTGRISKLPPLLRTASRGNAVGDMIERQSAAISTTSTDRVDPAYASTRSKGASSSEIELPNIASDQMPKDVHRQVRDTAERVGADQLELDTPLTCGIPPSTRSKSPFSGDWKLPILVGA